MAQHQRLTTREAAERLNCYPAQVIPLLKSAGIPFTRCGQSYLWDAESLERLLCTLHSAFRKNGGSSE